MRGMPPEIIVCSALRPGASGDGLSQPVLAIGAVVRTILPCEGIAETVVVALTLAVEASHPANASIHAKMRSQGSLFKEMGMCDVFTIFMILWYIKRTSSATAIPAAHARASRV